MTLEILRIEDIMALLKCSRATVDRWLRESREGRNDMPLPFSMKGRRVLFVAETFYDWIRHRQTNALPPVIPSGKERKRQQKEFKQRQESADQTLQRHRQKRKTRGGK
jgi:predicted DNA-binding transcriptional regulator AlpA